MNELSGEHAAAGVAPTEPQPKTSLATASLGPQSVAQLELLHGGFARLVPVAHTPQPVLDCRVRKNCPGLGDALVQFVDECDVTSAADAHTCQPTAQRSATLQPAPGTLPLLLPAPRLHAGFSVVESTPGMVNAPAHAAMSGYDERLR